MKRLACEMCGSTDLVKQDGIFVCQTCGCKYTVEEAKKMMVDGTVEVTGTVKIDQSSSIEKYFLLAQNAFESKNYSEAEKYCNRVIEIDENNWEAWFIKGKAVGRNSTIANFRLSETIKSFVKALEYAPSESKKSLANDCNSEIITLQLAFLNKTLENYAESHPERDYNNLISALKIVMNFSISFYTQAFKFLDKSILSDTHEEILQAKVIDQNLMTAFHSALNHFKKYDYPNKNQVDSFVNQIDYISKGEQIVILTILKEKEYNENRNKLIIEINEHLIEMFQSILNLPSYFGFKDTKIVNQRIDECKERIVEAKENRINYETEREKKRIEDYWNTHEEEKQSLLFEREQLASEKNQIEIRTATMEKSKEFVPAKYYLDNTIKQINTLKEQKSFLPAVVEKAKIEENIHSLQKKLSGLGVFQRKEKESTKWQIENLQNRLPLLENNAKYQINEINNQITYLESEKVRLLDLVLVQQKEIDNEIAPYQNRLDEINTRIIEIEEQLKNPK